MLSTSWIHKWLVELSQALLFYIVKVHFLKTEVNKSLDWNFPRLFDGNVDVVMDERLAQVWFWCEK